MDLCYMTNIVRDLHRLKCGNPLLMNPRGTIHSEYICI